MDYLSINGRTDLAISATDRALNYGDGLFTTAKISDGEIIFLADHIERLETGCITLAIDGVNFDRLIEHVTEVASAYNEAVLKIVISAGSGGRGYSRGGASPNIIVTVHPFPHHYRTFQEQGLSLGVADTMLGINPQLAGLKHLNRLEQVMVRKELDMRSEDDLLVLNVHQHVVEVSSANVFYQIGGQWYTPELNISGVKGLMRKHILATLPDVIICVDNLTALDGVSAMFICNCVFGIVPVKRFNNTELDLETVNTVKEICQC